MYGYHPIPSNFEICSTRYRLDQRILLTPRESAAPFTNMKKVELTIAVNERCKKPHKAKPENELEIVNIIVF